MEILPLAERGAAISAINNGDLVIVPTERWYMVCTDASNADACNQIFAAKRRSTSKSLALIVRSFGHAAELFTMNSHASRLGRSFWPGNLALVLPWQDPGIGERHAAVGAQNALVTCDKGVLGDLAAEAVVPVAATSANVSGNTGVDSSWPAITVAEVRRFAVESGLNVALCLDGGVCPAASHLTVVDCSNENAKITRAGLVHERAIAAVLGS